MDSKTKILIFTFSIGILSFLIANGTWAYVQDSVTSTGNNLSIGYIQLLIDGTPTNVKNFELTNLNSSGDYIAFDNITLQNKGTDNGKVFVQFISLDNNFTDANELEILIDDVLLFSNKINMASDPIYFGEIAPGSEITPNLVYIYNGNESNKTYKFYLSFSAKAVN